MPDFAYTMVPGKLKELLAKIRQVGVPQKATVAWLKTVGFTSSNDTSLLGVLKYIDLIDGQGTPTQRWTQYRGGTFKSVLGEAIRAGYKDLYAIYSDAHSRGKDDLVHVFSTSSTAGQQVISKTVATFKALCEDATFEGNGTEDKKMDSGPLHVPVTASETPQNHFATLVNQVSTLIFRCTSRRSRLPNRLIPFSKVWRSTCMVPSLND